MSKFLRIYVIFTPGSVRPLIPCIRTVLSNLSFSFTLVGNGLDKEEFNLLKALSSRFTTHSSIMLGGRHLLPHGQALTQLLAINTDDFFCFMDSDMFATGPLNEEFFRNWNPNVISSFTQPLWIEKNTKLESGFLGRNKLTPGGVLTGHSHFCVYPRSILDIVIRKFGVGFEAKPGWAIPDYLHKILFSAGWNGEFLDTCKLINLLSQEIGYILHHKNIKNLVHLGGLSREYVLIQNENSSSFTLTDELLKLDRQRSFANFIARYILFLSGKHGEPKLEISDVTLKKILQNCIYQIRLAHM